MGCGASTAHNVMPEAEPGRQQERAWDDEQLLKARDSVMFKAAAAAAADRDCNNGTIASHAGCTTAQKVVPVGVRPCVHVHIEQCADIGCDFKKEAKQEEDSPTSATMAKAVACARMGMEVISNMMTFAETVGGSVPLIGVALSALKVIVDQVEGAVANGDNLKSLRDRAADLLKVIVDNRDSLLQRKDKLHGQMSKFVAVLKNIEAYAKAFTGRNWLLNIINAGSDKSMYDGIKEELETLVKDVTFGLAADVHCMTTNINDYVDHSKEVSQMLEAEGGAAAVADDPVKLARITKQLDAGGQLAVTMMQQALEMLQSAQEVGIHTHIDHPDLRNFWRKNFPAQQKIAWQLWWSTFPNKIPGNDDMVKQLKAVLSSKESRQLFQHHIQEEQDKEVGVVELMKVAQNADLVQKVMDWTGQTRLSETGDSGANSGTPQQRVTLENASARAARCKLPTQDTTLYCGRLEDTNRITGELLGSVTVRSTPVCIVGQAGQGKSSLALSVGARMWQAGEVPGGAVLVDMREVHTEEDMLRMFCSALGISQGSDGPASASIIKELTRLTSNGQKNVLMIIDNAEDALGGSDECKAAITNLLAQIVRASGVLLLVTSRQALDLHNCSIGNYDLAPLSAEASGELVTDIAPHLTKDEKETIIGLCSGVPLLLQLVTNALAMGRCTIEELNVLGDSIGANNISRAIHLTVQSLPAPLERALAQLSVFPSVFDDKAAAAVLKVDARTAHHSIQQLYTHGLAMFNPDSGRYQLHMPVKVAAAERLSRQGNAALESQRRFVMYVLQLLATWSELFKMGAEQVATQLARKHTADIAAVFSLSCKIGVLDVPTFKAVLAAPWGVMGQLFAWDVSPIIAAYTAKVKQVFTFGKAA